MPDKRWLSRHRPLPAHVAALDRLFGPGIRILVDPDPFADADEVLARFRASGAEEIVLVAPLTVIAALCARGVTPLRAVMTPIPQASDPWTDVEEKGRAYRFSHFERILEVRLVTVPLDPEGGTACPSSGVCRGVGLQTREKEVRRP